MSLVLNMSNGKKWDYYIRYDTTNYQPRFKGESVIIQFTGEGNVDRRARLVVVRVVVINVQRTLSLVLNSFQLSNKKLQHAHCLNSNLLRKRHDERERIIGHFRRSLPFDHLSGNNAAATVENRNFR